MLGANGVQWNEGKISEVLWRTADVRLELLQAEMISWKTLLDKVVACRWQLKYFMLEICNNSRGKTSRDHQCSTALNTKSCSRFCPDKEKNMRYHYSVIWPHNMLMFSRVAVAYVNFIESFMRDTALTWHAQLAMQKNFLYLRWTRASRFLRLSCDRVYILGVIMLWLPEQKDFLYCQLRNRQNGTKRGKFKRLQQLPVISIYWEWNRG